MEMKTIREVVERETGVDISQATNKRDVVYARAIYFKLCKERTGKTLADIGKSVGKHHASVLHALNNVWPEVMAYDEVFAATYQQIADDELLCSCEERYDNLKKQYYKLLTKMNKKSLVKNES